MVVGVDVVERLLNDFTLLQRVGLSRVQRVGVVAGAVDVQGAVGPGDVAASLLDRLVVDELHRMRVIRVEVAVVSEDVADDWVGVFLDRVDVVDRHWAVVRASDRDGQG